MSNVYMAVMAFLIGAGYYLLRHKAAQEIKFAFRPEAAARKMMAAMCDVQCDEVFRRAGIRLSMARYTAVRNLVTVCLLAWTMAIAFSNGPAAARWPIVAIAICYYLSWPQEYTKRGKETPFKKMIEKLRASYLARRDDEQMSLVTQFKNMIVSQSRIGQSRSAESIIETLMKYATALTRPVFAQTLSLMRLADINLAADYFAEHFGTKIGDEFAAILSKMDMLDPSEFLVQVNSFQSTLREEKRTRRQKKQEHAGRYIFIFASCVVSIIMIDYIYILFKYLMEELVF